MPKPNLNPNLTKYAREICRDIERKGEMYFKGNRSRKVLPIGHALLLVELINHALTKLAGRNK